MLRNFIPPAFRSGIASVLLLAVFLLVVLLTAHPAGAAPAGAAERGRQLIDQYQCGRCHAIPGVPAARGRFAVTLQSFGQRSYIAGRIPNGADALVRWIVDPPALVPGTPMPNLGVSPAEARDMAAYLGGLR